jgi:hypothetical protein
MMTRPAIVGCALALAACSGPEQTTSAGSDNTTALLGKLETRAAGPAGAVAMEEVVAHVMRREMPGVVTCYQTALKNNPALLGTLRARIAVAEAGVISRVRVDSSDIQDTRFTSCVERAVAAWRFPADCAGAEITVPLVFKPGAPPAHESLKRHSLAQREIQAAMFYTKSSVQACFDRFRVPGTYVVAIVAGADGVPSSVTAVGNVPDSASASCICAAVKAQARYPSFDGATISFSYPFVFK